MNKTLILLTTHRGVSDDTYECVMRTGCPNVLKVKGQACIDRARSIAFDQALTAFRNAPVELDTLLLVDDDMTFSLSDAQRLVDMSRASRHPVSAVAVNAKGEIAAHEFPTGIVTTRPRWATGLAFMAIPRTALEALADTLPTLGGIREWCHTGRHERFPDQWIGEDYWFCSHFRGVELANIHVGHVKPIVLKARQ